MIMPEVQQPHRAAFVAAAIDVQHEAHTGGLNAPSRGIRAMALSRSMARNS